MTSYLCLCFQAKHGEQHEGKYYSIPLQDLKTVFPHGLPPRYMMQAGAQTEQHREAQSTVQLSEKRLNERHRKFDISGKTEIQLWTREYYVTSVYLLLAI